MSTEPFFLSVAASFSRTPGPRYEIEGEFSGEVFRRDCLLPIVKDAIAAGRKLMVDLDGTAGYGTSFLEEAFGGLVRVDGITAPVLDRLLLIKSDEEDFLVSDVRSYISEAPESSK